MISLLLASKSGTASNQCALECNSYHSILLTEEFRGTGLLIISM